MQQESPNPSVSSNPVVISAADAIKRSGGPTKLAAAISTLTPDRPITDNAIRQWRFTAHKTVPSRHVRAVAHILKVDEAHLRPDVFGRLQGLEVSGYEAASL